jgi:hypothetical protein
VRDLHGHVVWRITVGRNEMTCLDCGDVAINGVCVRCSMLDDGTAPEGLPTDRGRNLVPTLSYLQDGEYVQI